MTLGAFFLCCQSLLFAFGSSIACFTRMGLVLGLLCIPYGRYGQVQFYNRVRVDVGICRRVIQMDLLLRNIHYVYCVVRWLVETVALAPSTKFKSPWFRNEANVSRHFLHFGHVFASCFGS